MDTGKELENCDFANISDEEVGTAVESEHLSVLPPDHPLLERFQQALREHLLRTKHKLENEIADINYQLKSKEQHREEQGLALYDMQQKINFQEDQMTDIFLEIEEHVKKRRNEEINATTLRKELEEKQKLAKAQNQLYQQRMLDLEDLQGLRHNIKKWAYDVKDEVKNAKCIVNRDTQLQKQLSEEKKKSDILFYRLEIEVKKRNAELKLICEEESAMTNMIQVINMSITNANTDLEALQNEHKQLHQAWSEVIIAIQLRDKILFQVQENLRKHKESIKLNITGIESIKKQIEKDMDLNRRLETFKKRLADDTNTLRRECQNECEVLNALQSKLDELPDFLSRTEIDLKEASRDGSKLFSEIRKLDFVLDKYYQKKLQTEEAILKLAQTQLISNKASSYRFKLLNKAQEHRRQVDLSLSKAQNQLASTMLEVEKLRSELFNVAKKNGNLQRELDQAELKTNQLDTDSKQIQIQIDIKMKRFERLSKEIENCLKAYGEASSNSTEMKIKQIEKSIHSGEQQIREHQQFWIMLQNHFVNLSQKRSDQLNEIQVTRKQLSIIKQKSLKIEQDLGLAKLKSKDLILEIQKLTSKMQSLNDKIYKKRQHNEVEETEYANEQAETNQMLKDIEHKILKLESDINELQIELDVNKDIVLDSHREALSWETKLKLVEETMSWSKSESLLNSEIGAMKVEIHRMHIRYGHLKRAQDKLILDLQHCVMHREQIFVSATVKEYGDAKMKNLKNSSQAQIKLDELRSKAKLIQNEITYISEKRLSGDVNDIERMIYILRKLQSDLQEVTNEDTSLCAQIEDGILLKHANLEQIIRKQNRAKAYRRLTDGKFEQTAIRSASKIQQQEEKQNEMNMTLLEIIHTLIIDYPDKKNFFTKVVHVLKR